MTEFRLVRQFDGKTSTSESRAYRVETVALMTEQEAMQLMRDLGSPYQGQKYDDSPRVGATEWGTAPFGDGYGLRPTSSKESAEWRSRSRGEFVFSRPPMGQWKLVEQ